MTHRYRWRVAVLLQWFVALMTGLGGSFVPTMAGAQPAANTHIAAGLVAEGPAAPGGTVMLAITMRPDPGWHGYWQNPGDAGFGMKLDWNLPAGATAGAPLYPVPRTLVIAGLMNHVYEEAYAVLVPLRLPAGAAPGSRLDVTVQADWLACTDQVCVPERARLGTVVSITAPGVPAAHDPRFEQWRARLPA
ncbi:MAG TPA: protein-disulfide reductase DsbD N-terminal domain-containing protein, partial [Novosphingobium sp.]